MDSLSSKTDTFIALDERYGAKNYKPLDIVIEHAQGVWLTDVEGKRYLDGLAAYSAVNQGHCHPRLIKTLTEQAQKATLTSRAFRNNEMGLFLKELCEVTNYDMALPMNTGAEAVETAIKAARKWGYQTKNIPQGQAELIVFSGNFHGRTTTLVGFSSEAQYKQDFGPFTPGFITVAYGDAEAVAKAITPNTVGILLEPIQGEAGVVIPPARFLKTVDELCKTNNVLFIADEIQTGLGRAGALIASELEAVKPDMLILGKALSGGFYPVSAVLASKAVLGLFKPGDHGSTYAGNPLGAAVAREALKILNEEKLVENAQTLGKYALERLKTISNPLIKEVRGRGLFIALELYEPARPYCEALAELGLLCKETHQNVIRFAPPLIINKAELDWAIEQFRFVFENEHQEVKPMLVSV